MKGIIVLLTALCCAGYSLPGKAAYQQLPEKGGGSAGAQSMKMQSAKKQPIKAERINRKAVVDRHRVIITQVDTLGALTVGNGQFAFTVDVTGLQSFPAQYAHGIPLGTQSEWGWHSFPNKAGYQFSETLRPYDFHHSSEQYAVQWDQPLRNKEAADFFRQNPHRLQLGNIGLELLKKDGSLAGPEDLQDIHQELDLWTGQIISKFKLDGITVQVITCADAVKDIIGVKIISPLLKERRLRLRCRFPFPTNGFKDEGVNYSHAGAHTTSLMRPDATTALFTRQLDKDKYYVSAQLNSTVTVSEQAPHDYALTPAATDSVTAVVLFSPAKPDPLPGFNAVRQSSINGWRQFWLSGAAVDFAGSTDNRAAELERRVVLSQYLTRVQCAGHFPPQETGLTYNSWYGKPHMEMIWWHAAHYALWGRTELLEKSMQWYFTAFKGAEGIARRQGYKGVRWQKMTDHVGGEAPSSVGSFLVWQQPHVIYLAELIYRNKPSKALLQRYAPLIFATADFMASFAAYDSATGRYNLGKGIIPAQECFNPSRTYNPPYELAYWKWALEAAQTWRKRMGLAPNKSWQQCIDHLAPMAQKDGVYLAAESVPDSYTPDSKYLIDHPAVLMALGVLPVNHYVDTAVMHRTFNLVETTWNWGHTWGWDFPMVAMTATRLRQPEKALAALFKNVTTNTYLINGHNYQDGRLTLYLPGNGSLLAAVALMCAGADGDNTLNPGFPANGKWQVRCEGFKAMP